jgi:hypothetical protein
MAGTLDRLFVAGFVVYLIIGWYLSSSDAYTDFLRSCKDSDYSIVSGMCEYAEKKLTLKGLSVIMFLVGCYVWLMLIYYVNTENTNGPKQYNLNRQKIGVSSVMSFLSNVFILAVVVALLMLVITAVLNAIGRWSRTTSAVLTTLNILNVVTILSIVYIYFIKNINWGETPTGIFSLLKYVIFYIPCVLIGIVESVTGEYNRTPRKAVILLLVEAAVITLYFALPLALGTAKNSIGKTLLEGPVYLNNQYTLGSYQDLTSGSVRHVRRRRGRRQEIINSTTDDDADNGTGQSKGILETLGIEGREVRVDYDPQQWPTGAMPATYDYNYALSSWLYINPQPPSTNHHYSKFTRLLDYGGKPAINYKGKDNTLQIVMRKDKKKETVVYEDSSLQLQKWNHVFINYDGGTLDVFVNGELVSSTPSVAPYMTRDLINSGVDGGVHGGIANVMYFDKVLGTDEISLLYESGRIKTPPLL